MPIQALLRGGGQNKGCKEACCANLSESFMNWCDDTRASGVMILHDIKLHDNYMILRYVSYVIAVLAR